MAVASAPVDGGRVGVVIQEQYDERAPEPTLADVRCALSPPKEPTTARIPRRSFPALPT